MTQKELNMKERMVRLIADSGYCMTRVGTPLAEVSKAFDVTVPEHEKDQWTEVPIADVEAAKAEAEAERQYAERVVALIRRRYSADDETAILRKFANAWKLSSETSLPETLSYEQEQFCEAAYNEFKEYNAFAEQCKAEAKQ